MGNTLDGQSAHVDVVIIGGGPTGLGAAYRFVCLDLRSIVLAQSYLKKEKLVVRQRYCFW